MTLVLEVMTSVMTGVLHLVPVILGVILMRIALVK